MNFWAYVLLGAIVGFGVTVMVVIAHYFDEMMWLLPIGVLGLAFAVKDIWNATDV